MTISPNPSSPAQASAAPCPAFIPLAGIYFQHGTQWLELNESGFIEVGVGRTISLLEPLSPQPTRATIGVLEPGNYQREGRTLGREQLLRELAGAPVAFRARVEWNEQAQAWLVQLQD